MARQSAHRSAAALRAALRLALLAASLWLLLATAATPVALAQDAPPPDPPPAAGPAPTVDPLAGVKEAMDGVKEGVERLPERIASALWDMTAGRLLKLLLSVVGFGFALFGYLAGGALSGVNFFSQIPEPWVTLTALDGLRARLLPLAVRVGALAGTLIVARWVAGAAFDWPFPGWTFAVVRVAALAPLVAAAPAGMLALIRAGNALSAALFDPGGGLPGLANADSYDKAAGTGIAMLFYFATCLWLRWVRVQIVLTALLLFATSPLAVACWALPFGTCHWIARAWLTTFIGTVAVQVLMALTLGIGAALLTANVVQGGTEGAPAGVVDVGLAAALVGATCWIPRRVLGALVAHAPPGAGLVVAGLKAGVVLSGAGWLPGMAGLAGQTVRRPPPASVHAVPPSPAGGPAGPPPPTGRVGSLLGGQRPLLLPPPGP